MQSINLHANTSKELTLKVLNYIDRCQKQGIVPSGIKPYQDHRFLYSVTIQIKGEVNYGNSNENR